MSAVKLKDNVYYVGVKDPNLAVFDIIMETRFGTTYNAYMVKGEKTALIETVHDKGVDEYIDNINGVQDIKTIEYVICNHTEPDHSGSLVKLLELNPDLIVLGTTAALNNLKQITNLEFKSQLVKDGDTLDLGNGLILNFIIAPNLHWPDTMMTYLASEKVLFSCDVLGAHYCPNGLLDSDIQNKDDYDAAFKEYYDAIVAPFAPFVQKGLLKLEGIDVDMVCNSHGPVLTTLIGEGIKKYDEWSKPVEREKKTAAIFYVSAYGYTKKLAKAMEKSLESAGISVKSYDLIEHDMHQMRAEMNSADMIFVGTPTINRNALEPVWELLAGIDMMNVRGKTFAVFGSYGWSGEGCPLVEAYLKALKLKVFETPYRVVFNPSEEDLKGAGEFAVRMAKGE